MGDLGAMPGSTFVWGHGGSLPDTTLLVPNIVLQTLMTDSLGCVVSVKPDDCLNFSHLHSFSLERGEIGQTFG